jgi:uncharacterized protein (TIGR02147 family)
MRKKTFSIYNYIDYRRFLTDYYRWYKENTRGFSHRRMAASLGFTSPNFLKLVIDGNRNIGPDSLKKIADGIGLNQHEKEYFSSLVSFDQAKQSAEKTLFLGRLVALRNQNGISRVAPEQYEYFSEWYHPAVREIVKGLREPLDYTVLSRRMNNRVSPSRIRKSVALLKKLGLLRLDETSAYVHSSPILNTENDLNTIAVRQYHKAALDIAQKALDDVAPEQRENSHATISVSSAGFETIKQRIQAFREELLQLVAGDANTKEVYHVNIQLYPVTGNECHGNN